MRFQADEVIFEPCDDEYVAHAFLRSLNKPEKHYLMINRYVNPGKESEIFLECDDQLRTVRGGIAALQLRRNGMTIYLERKAAETLCVLDPPEIVVDFELTAASLIGLRDALAAIFADHPHYQDESRG